MSYMKPTPFTPRTKQMLLEYLMNPGLYFKIGSAA